MSYLITQIRDKEENLASITEQWEAANDQLDTTVNQAEKPVLQAKIGQLEQQIESSTKEITDLKRLLDHANTDYDASEEAHGRYAIRIVQHATNPDSEFIGKLRNDLLNELNRPEAQIECEVITVESPPEFDLEPDINCVILIATEDIEPVAKRILEIRKIRSGENRLEILVTSSLPDAEQYLPMGLALCDIIKIARDNNDGLERLANEIGYYRAGYMSRQKKDLQQTGEKHSHGQFQIQHWKVLLNSIINNENVIEVKSGCIPIIGPDVCKNRVTSDIQLAEILLKAYPYDLDDEPALPRILQFLAYVQFGTLKSAKERLIELRYRETTEDRLNIEPSRDPHYILAGLPFPIYFTANQDDLLEQALISVGKKPIIYTDWYISDEKDVFDLAGVEIQKPAVFHLFGDKQDVNLLKATEHEFIEFIYKVSGDGIRIPKVVQNRVSDSILVLIGFGIHQWYFQSVLRLFSPYLQKRDTKAFAIMTPTAKAQGDVRRVYTYVADYLANITNIEAAFQDSLSFLLELEHRKQQRHGVKL